MSEMQTDLGPIHEQPGERELAERAVRRMVGEDGATFILAALGLLYAPKKPMPHKTSRRVARK